MHFVNMHEAKTKLSVLVEEAMAGENVIIAKAGKPCVKLVPLHVDERPRKAGKYKGQITISDDFDHTPEEIIDAFEGRK